MKEDLEKLLDIAEIYAHREEYSSIDVANITIEYNQAKAEFLAKYEMESSKLLFGIKE